MLEVLDKNELESMSLFKKYINKSARPTAYAVGCGLINYINKNHMVSSSYFTSDTSDINFSHVLIVNEDGLYKYASKSDKYFVGIRPAIHTSNLITKYVLDGISVNDDISVIEFGYYPKSLMKRQREKINTGYKIKIPISKYNLSKSTYEEVSVYKNENNEYFIEVPIFGLSTRIENDYFLDGSIATFKIEPIRFWVDKNTGFCISQDIISGGISYKMNRDFFEVDDYNDSDLKESLIIMEENMSILFNLLHEKNMGRSLTK